MGNRWAKRMGQGHRGRIQPVQNRVTGSRLGLCPAASSVLVEHHQQLLLGTSPSLPSR